MIRFNGVRATQSCTERDNDSTSSGNSRLLGCELRPVITASWTSHDLDLPRFFPMSSPPRKDIASLVRGLSFTHQPAVDTSSTQQGGKKEKIGDDLMDFSSIVDASKSVSKDPPVETGIKGPSIGRVEETIFTNPSTSDNLMSGTSDAVSLSSVDKKKYKLFCAPSRTSGCDQLCRQFIGQGSTICINVDCKTVHRGGTREKANVDMDQLFVLKARELSLVNLP